MNKRNSLAAGTALMLAALAFTGQFESAGGKPHLTAYRDPGGVVTICNGITGPDIKMGMTVTKEWCDNRFSAELEKHSKPLDKVPYQMSNAARVAWADFLFNLGTGIAADTTTPWRRLMAGDWSGSCDAFLMYRYTRVGDTRRDCSRPASKCTGIWTRRNAQRDLCQGRITVEEFLRIVRGTPMNQQEVTD